MIDDAGQQHPRLRPPGTSTPCATCPKESPTAGKELTEQNWLAWNFDRECKAVNSWPNDPIVRRNAAIIRDVEESLEVSKFDRIIALLSGGLR